jgi:hypothetical protein
MKTTIIQKPVFTLAITDSYNRAFAGTVESRAYTRKQDLYTGFLRFIERRWWLWRPLRHAQKFAEIVKHDDYDCWVFKLNDAFFAKPIVSMPYTRKADAERGMLRFIDRLSAQFN